MFAQWNASANAQKANAMIHTLDPSPETVHWGHFDAALKPVLTIDSGDTVVITTVSGAQDHLPASGFAIPPELPAIHAAVPQKLGPHILTGPVAVRGAKAGQVLELQIRDIALSCSWGYNVMRPGFGVLPDDIDTQRVVHIPLDRKTKTARLAWGAEIPLQPFFGVMGLAPPASEGAVSSVPPHRSGGNIDCKELVAGSILYLPIAVDGALFSAGDGHGAQGDGEVCLTAIETGLTGTFEFHLRDDLRLDWPQAETPTHVITMAFDPDLDRCAELALRQMIALIVARRGLSFEDAYMLCSLAANLRVTQIVNRSKGVHMMLDKRYLDAP